MKALPAKVAWILGIDVLGLGVCRASTVLQAALYKVLVSNLAGVSRVDLRPNLASKTIKWTGIVLQFRLHEKSARQTNSKTNRQASSWCRAIPARLLSSTQLYDTLALAPNANGNTNSAALEEAAGGSRFFNSASYTQRLKMPVNISLAFMIRRNMSAKPPGCED